MSVQQTTVARRAATVLTVLLCGAIGKLDPLPATAERTRSGQGGVAVQLVLPRYTIPENEKRGRDGLGRDRRQMWRYRSGLQRRGIADLDPSGENSLQFRATNHHSMPVTVRFSGVLQMRHSPGHLTVASVQPQTIRLPPNGERKIVVQVASKNEASGTAIFRFLVSTAGRAPEVTGCRVRYEFDPFSE